MPAYVLLVMVMEQSMLYMLLMSFDDSLVGVLVVVVMVVESMSCFYMLLESLIMRQ